MLQRMGQARRKDGEFPCVLAREACQERLAFACQAQDGAAAICRVFFARQETFPLGAVDEFDGAVVLDAQSLGHVGDGDGRALGRAGYLEQKLMLLRLKARCQSGLLAEVQEAPQLEAELGERAEEESGMSIKAGVGHIYIVSRHNVSAQGPLCGHRTTLISFVELPVNSSWG